MQGIYDAFREIVFFCDECPNENHCIASMVDLYVFKTQYDMCHVRAERKIRLQLPKLPFARSIVFTFQYNYLQNISKTYCGIEKVEKA